MAANGGDHVLTRSHAALERLLSERPSAVMIVSVEGAVEDTYWSLMESLN